MTYLVFVVCDANAEVVIINETCIFNRNVTVCILFSFLVFFWNCKPLHVIGMVSEVLHPAHLLATEQSA
jgi:hypothetical protein